MTFGRLFARIWFENFFSKAKDLEKSLTFGRILYTIVVLSEIPYFSEETL